MNKETAFALDYAPHTHTHTHTHTLSGGASSVLESLWVRIHRVTTGFHSDDRISHQNHSLQERQTWIEDISILDISILT